METSGWAQEKYGMGDWTPKNAEEFVSFIKRCGFEPINVWNDGNRIMTDDYKIGETGFLPHIINGGAVVAE